MYCSIHEAWDNKNSLSNLSKRYQENFNPSEHRSVIGGFRKYDSKSSKTNEFYEKVNPSFAQR